MFTLPNLPYDYKALEPHIDARTMEIHHGKHHAGYVAKLNAALEGTPQASHSLEDLLKNVYSLPPNKQTAIRNNGGGHANHSLFWTILSTEKTDPSPALKEAFIKTFSSYEDFQSQFSTAAASRFGSGWAWLVMNGDSLEVMSTPNQDSPLMDGKTPILGLDVWEHAYYLNYQNRRPDYIKNFFTLINWKEVSRLYEQRK